MACAQKLPAYISPQDYLMLEERSLEKHECVDRVICEWQGGGTFGRAGGSKPHNRTSLDIYAALRLPARELFEDVPFGTRS